MFIAARQHLASNLPLRQFIFFVAIGIIATATHAAAALTAHSYLGYSPLAANLFGYISAFMLSYLGNARLTFRRRVLHGAQFARFMAISLTTLAFNQATVFILTEMLRLPFVVALAPTVVLVPVFSFVVSKLWAFSEQSLQP